MRPAPNNEIFAKQFLEPRPSRARAREIMEESFQDHVPFSDDCRMSSLDEDDQQQLGYVEITAEAGVAPPSVEPAPTTPSSTILETEETEHIPPLPSPAEEPTTTMDDDEPNPPLQPPSRRPSTSTENKLEQKFIPNRPRPSQSMPQPAQLQQALRRCTDLLDGLPRPPGLPRRD